MGNVEAIPTVSLYWRKARGCFCEFGLLETIRRSFREVAKKLKQSEDQLDISLVTDRLAIGAAPRYSEALERLQHSGFNCIIDLRAERKQSDILARTRAMSVNWIPTYDDWRSKSEKFYTTLSTALNSILSNGGKLFLCCGAGEHRAPLAGVLALVTLGYSVEAAAEMIQKARPVAELLPVYRSSLVDFLENNHLPAGRKG